MVSVAHPFPVCLTMTSWWIPNFISHHGVFPFANTKSGNFYPEAEIAP
jgi:hypothetical protein